MHFQPLLIPWPKRALTALVCAVVWLGSPGAAAAQTNPDFAALAREQSPAVVAIMTRQQAEQQALQLPPGTPFGDLFRRFQEAPDGRQEQVQTGLGSGFVIGPEGHVVTAHHVIRGAIDIVVTFSDGRSVAAHVVGTDPATDTAVLKIDPVPGMTVTRWGDSKAIEPGAWVVAIGSPFGLGGTVTVGVLSARSRDLPVGEPGDLLQTDAAINRGNSGGPLFNARGEVVGVNMAIVSPSGVHAGVGFAVPSHTAEPVVRQLIDTGRVERGFIGVRVQEITPKLAQALNLDKAHGALVASIQSESPADRAGLRPGDVITRAGEQHIANARDLTRTVAQTRPGTRLEFQVLRAGKEQRITIALGRRPGPEPEVTGAAPPRAEPDRLGVSVVPLQKGRAADPDIQGALVQRVEPGSAAALGGIRRGDVIVAVNGKAIQEPDGLMHVWQAARKQNRPVLLRVYREGDFTYLAIG